MLNRSEKTIVISDEYIYTPKIESVAQMSTSPFSGIYRDAMKSLEYICKQVMDDKPGNEPVKECDPIIAFVGGRGSGKTSALESFRRALQAGYYCDDKTVWPDNTILTSSKFDVLPIIDPTALSEHESLLGVIAAHMYRQIERLQYEYRSNRKGDDPDTAIRNAALQLSKLYDALRALNQERSEQIVEFGGYERLGQLSMSYNLREQFKNAVDAYLKLTAQIDDGLNHANRHRFLVITIDDLDMNAINGYKLCEELRKYMMVPDIVVLMSAKIDQLQSVIAQELAKQLTNKKDDSDIMAERYLAKLIPINRRHALPIFTIYNMIDYAIAPKEGGTLPLVDAFFNLLYDRLGLILIKNDIKSHVILPRTLRGIVHLFYLLRDMPAVFDSRNPTPLKYDDKHIKNIEKLPHNIDAFWDHLLNITMEEAVDPTHNLLVQMRTEHWSSVNRLVVKEIRKIMDSEKMLSEESKHWYSIKDICSVETIKENVSLGDALYMLDRLETWAATPQWDRFVASIRVAYSLLLTRMFFIDQRPDNMRRFIVQLNNPDQQELVRPSREDIEETADWRRRDWQPRLDWTSIVFLGEKNSSLAEYYAGMRDESIINNDNPLKWLILSIVWCGSQRGRTPIYWRSAWDKPYLNSTEMLDNPQTLRIAINYIAFVTNLLSPATLWNRNADESGENYVMFVPLYSADLIQYIVGHSNTASSPKKAPENKDFGYFECFIEGIAKSIDNLNKRSEDAAKQPYVIAMEPLHSAVMAGYKKIAQIQRLSPELDKPPEQEKRLIIDHMARLSFILSELTAQDAKGKIRLRRAGTIAKYCDEIIRMFGDINVMRPSQEQIVYIKNLNENVPLRGSPKMQDELIRVLKNIIEGNTQVTTNG